MIKKLKLALIILPLAVFSCKKDPGPGGTSSVKGTVVGFDHEYGDKEITEIVFTNGLEIEHGEYWLLNSPDPSKYYYIWYDNPGWVSNGDPMLQGRTGIPVSFNYSDDNLTIAQNTADAIVNNTGGFFTVELFNDILRITNAQVGYTPDADEVTSPFEFNIIDQGKNSIVLETGPKADERCYLDYGNSGTYNDDIRTGIDGDFQFNNLQIGNYSLYVISKDTVNGGNVKVSVDFEIDEKKSEIDLGEITVVH